MTVALPGPEHLSASEQATGDLSNTSLPEASVHRPVQIESGQRHSRRLAGS